VAKFGISNVFDRLRVEVAGHAQALRYAVSFANYEIENDRHFQQSLE